MSSHKMAAGSCGFAVDIGDPDDHSDAVGSLQGEDHSLNPYKSACSSACPFGSYELRQDQLKRVKWGWGVLTNNP
jgi:hypothetical protein